MNPLTGDRAGIRATFASLWSRHARSLLMAVVALLVGVGVGRFVTYTDESALAPAPASRATPADRILSLERATFERPDDPVAWQELGTAHVRQATVTGDPAQYELAQRALDRAASLDPGASATKVAQATLALSLHEFDRAHTLALSVLDDEPVNPRALAVLVDAQVELGSYDEAAGTLQRLLDIRPDLPALARTSYLRQLRGDLDGALAAIRRAQTAGAGLTVDLARVTAIEGTVHLLRGDPGRALESFDRALGIVPDLSAAVVGRARALAATGDTDRAVTVLSELLDRHPTAEAATLLGELQTGERAQMSFDLVRSIYALQASAGQVIDLEAALFEADHGDPTEAVRLARAAHDQRQTVFTADALAWSLHRAGRSADAVPFARAAVADGNPEPAVQVHAVAVLHGTGQTADARALLQLAADTGGWLSPSLRPVVTDLAGTLDVELPEAWR